jgi:uroporphyrinogen decarboxylase
MNKRDTILSLASGSAPDTVPAAFFMHFDPSCHRGQPAIDKHLEFFRATGMDFVKIQFEQPLPPHPIQKPEDWATAPLYPDEFFEPMIAVADGLVKAAKSEAVVVMTLYSPFMWAGHLVDDALLVEHLRQNPDAVGKGLEIMTQNVLKVVRGCQRVGIDGFYASTQGGESDRFGGSEIFTKVIQPTDRAVWDEIEGCTFNILHVCDYDGPYDDLTPFLDYPGHVVNASLTVGGKTLSPKEIAQMFKRPFMGGLERKGVLATGSKDDIRREAEAILAQAPDQFILAADCTVPSDTPWDNLRAAVDAAHSFKHR